MENHFWPTLNGLGNEYKFFHLTYLCRVIERMCRSLQEVAEARVGWEPWGGSAVALFSCLLKRHLAVLFRYLALVGGWIELLWWLLSNDCGDASKAETVAVAVSAFSGRWIAVRAHLWVLPSRAGGRVPKTSHQSALRSRTSRWTGARNTKQSSSARYRQSCLWASFV